MTAGGSDRPAHAKLRLGQLSIEGWSRAGEESWFRVHPPGLAFDCGRGALELSGARDLFVSHGHLDHALGVPWVLSQRTLHHREPTRVVCPRAVAGLDGARLAELRRAGMPIEVESEEVWLSYCGDTGAGVFDLAPRLGESRVLMIECTFLGAAMRRRGSEYGHLHVEQLAEQAHRLGGCEAILLHHLSRRHSVAELRAEVERLLPELAPRVHLLFEAAR